MGGEWMGECSGLGCAHHTMVLIVAWLMVGALLRTSSAPVLLCCVAEHCHGSVVWPGIRVLGEWRHGHG